MEVGGGAEEEASMSIGTNGNHEARTEQLNARNKLAKTLRGLVTGRQVWCNQEAHKAGTPEKCERCLGKPRYVGAKIAE